MTEDMHPSQPATGEPLVLGWHTCCLTVKDLHASSDFYSRAGFTVVGGQPEQHWLALNNASTDLSILQQDLPANCLNFRGADIHALAAEHRERGFDLVGLAEYDPSDSPPDWHTDESGVALPLAGSASYTIMDPDGNVLFFDTVPLERERFAAGQPYCWPGCDGNLQEGQLPMGWLHVCLAVADIGASVSFYERLGLTLIEDHRPEGWSILGANEPGYFRVALFQGHIERNLINFRGEEITALADRLRGADIVLNKEPRIEADGSASFEVRDPDDNVIYFNTLPGETP